MQMIYKIFAFWNFGSKQNLFSVAKPLPFVHGECLDHGEFGHLYVSACMPSFRLLLLPLQLCNISMDAGGLSSSIEPRGSWFITVYYRTASLSSTPTGYKKWSLGGHGSSRRQLRLFYLGPSCARCTWRMTPLVLIFRGKKRKSVLFPGPSPDAKTFAEFQCCEG